MAFPARVKSARITKEDRELLAFVYHLDELDPEVAILRLQTARSWLPSVLEGPAGRASSRPPREPIASGSGLVQLGGVPRFNSGV